MNLLMTSQLIRGTHIYIFSIEMNEPREEMKMNWNEAKLSNVFSNSSLDTGRSRFKRREIVPGIVNVKEKKFFRTCPACSNVI